MSGTAGFALVLFLAVFGRLSADYSCTSSVPVLQRTDCYPGSDSSKEKCQARGCTWCESSVSGVPWCFHESVSLESATCSNSLPLDQREDCHPEAYNTYDRCTNKGCTFCQTNQNGIPWCFYPSGSKRPGGDTCPSKIADDQRIDCFPTYLGTANKDNCVSKGCFWCSSSRPNTPWCFLDSRDWPADNFDANERVDCFPDLKGTLDPRQCVARGCRYRPTGTSGAPWCFFPREKGYAVVKDEQTTKGRRLTLKRDTTLTLFAKEIADVIVDIEFQTNGRVRVKLTDANDPSRFEVPLNITSPNAKAPNPIYDVQISTSPVFTFKVVRKDTGVAVFDTSIGGLLLEDQFLQIATKLPSSNVYGFGMHQHYSYKHNMNWQTWGMFTRDQPPMDGGANLYGVHPFYMGLEDNGKAHGVLFLNSNAQDVTLSPAPALTYRTIGGVLDLYFFLGPTPENVVQQYTEAIGRPFMPPYWSLGFSLGNYGYDNIQNMKNVVSKMKEKDIPHDYQFGDIDYMDRALDFTYSTTTYPGLPDYVKQLKNDGTKFIIILDPAIAKDIPNYRPYDLGMKKDIWVKDSNGLWNVEGKVWPPTNVFYPDFTKPETTDWWVTLCKEFKNVIDYDGLWIDMNEPANFVWGDVDGCASNNINNPPYFPKIWGPVLQYKTLCPDHKHHIGLHYDVHSLYGWSQAPVTFKAAREATGKRSIVLSRSTFPGAGKFAATWLGDNWSYWTNLRYSIIGMLEFNIFGMPFVGADICGFIRDSNYELCMRWQQVGAFYPFSRNHNLGYENRPQDPTAWGDDFARNARDTLRTRYTLLPYLYTLFHEAHTRGDTVIRALFHEFPSDGATHGIDRQFLWGSSFLVSPVLDQGATSVNAYFPNARWYSYYDGAEVGTRGDWKTLDAQIWAITLHVRGGYILPTQEPARTTMASRKNPLGLIAALDDNEQASGSLFWDDGESIDTYENGNYHLATFNVTSDTLTISVVHGGFPSMNQLKLNTVRVFGMKSTSISSVTQNGNQHSDYVFNQASKELKITNLQLDASQGHTITWVKSSAMGPVIG
ncbi:maltase-glucoamylase, intestinal-like isoform X2 [Lingula anatina]|uniref:Maltase-glucoamylase, intestinal-like isoform X2 n=1 Tax=Lingula anatina TaxID=7574 RepID=A0A1S3JD59_LINAN|nr:maltase-glucoamylase, intestinal-like isoform X2 [Lingula anatina]|eukprot:XP_013408342.1 maltase-glucoamylase, intestinal-like isoform X2 [Lingula anatina]